MTLSAYNAVVPSPSRKRWIYELLVVPLLALVVFSYGKPLVRIDAGNVHAVYNGTQLSLGVNHLTRDVPLAGLPWIAATGALLSLLVYAGAAPRKSLIAVVGCCGSCLLLLGFYGLLGFGVEQSALTAVATSAVGAVKSAKLLWFSLAVISTGASLVLSLLSVYWPSVEASTATYTCGTLTYTQKGLVALFVWILWGDFCFVLMETVIPSIFPLYLLRTLKASNTVTALLMTQIPSFFGVVVGPIVGFKSDRHRGKWGRRLPFILFTAPILVVALAGLGFSESFHTFFLHSNIPAALHISPLTATLLVIGFFMIIFAFGNEFVNTVFWFLYRDVVPEKMLSRFLALMRVVGSLAGSLWALFVYPHAIDGLREIYLGCAALYLVGFTAMCFKVKEGQYPPPEPIEIKKTRDRRLIPLRERWVFGTFAVAGLLFAIVCFFFPLVYASAGAAERNFTGLAMVTGNAPPAVQVDKNASETIVGQSQTLLNNAFGGAATDRMLGAILALAAIGALLVVLVYSLNLHEFVLGFTRLISCVVALAIVYYAMTGFDLERTLAGIQSSPGTQGIVVSKTMWFWALLAGGGIAGIASLLAWLCPIRDEAISAQVGTYLRECFKYPMYLATFAQSMVSACSSAANIGSAIFVLDALHIPLATQGRFGAVFAWVGICLQWPAGWLADKFGPMRVLLIMTLVTLPINFLCFFFQHSLNSWLMFAGIGLITGPLLSAASAPYLLLIFPKDKFGQYSSFNGTMKSIIRMIIPTIGALYIDHMTHYGKVVDNYRYCYLWSGSCGCISFVSLAIVYFMWKQHGGPDHYIAPGSAEEAELLTHKKAAELTPAIPVATAR